MLVINFLSLIYPRSVVQPVKKRTTGKATRVLGYVVVARNAWYAYDSENFDPVWYVA